MPKGSSLRRLAGALPLLAALVAALSASAAPPIRVHARRAVPGHAGISASSNWSGYAVSGTGFGDVRATWVQPGVTCAAAASYSSFWIGLGGFSDGANGLEQIGTEADCRGGAPVYSAWYELIPDAAVPVELDVAPGDTVTAEVSAAGNVVTLTLADRTAGTSFSTPAELGDNLDLSSAEWIAEAPSACTGPGTTNCQILPLANFGSAGFSSAQATSLDGHTGPIGDPAWEATAIQLVGAGGSAVPSALAADAAGFTIGYQPPAQAVAPRPKVTQLPGLRRHPKPKPRRHAKSKPTARRGTSP
jgi:hypothetical protein